MAEVKTYDEFYQFVCIFCGIPIVVMKHELNCEIFRCGIMKQTGSQIDQHLNKQACDDLVANDLIIGCAKPFKFDGVTVVECDYI